MGHSGGFCCADLNLQLPLTWSLPWQQLPACLYWASPHCPSTHSAGTHCGPRRPPSKCCQGAAPPPAFPKASGGQPCLCPGTADTQQRLGPPSPPQLSCLPAVRCASHLWTGSGKGKRSNGTRWDILDPTHRYCPARGGRLAVTNVRVMEDAGPGATRGV